MEKLLARLSEIAAELSTLNEAADEDGSLTDEQAERFTELEAEFTELDEQRVTMLARLVAIKRVEDAALEVRNVEIPVQVELERAAAVVPGMLPDPFDLSEFRHNAPVADWRSRAVTGIEQAVDVPDYAKAEAVRKLEDHEHVSDPQGKLPQLILHTSSPLYRQAWVKAMAGRESTWSPEEAAAMDRVESMRTALGLTESGFAVPAVIDATVVLLNAGSTNAVRRVARVESITANSWKPITSGGIAASFDAELAEVSDDTPTFTQPEIHVHKAQAFAMGSIEMQDDWAAIGAELGREFADAKDVLEGNMHIKGTGSDQPFGIEVELDGGSSEIDPATPEAFAIADVYATIEAVPPRYRRTAAGQGPQNGSFATLAELSTINGMRQFATANNYHAFLTDLGGGQPAVLLGYPLLEASDMDALSDLDAAATADNFLLFSGDWSKYVIVDRIGMSVEFIPHLFATASNLPNGSRGWYAYWRTGAESIADAAFATMSVPTAA
jgi:HK97 family phage major capsid protein